MDNCPQCGKKVTGRPDKRFCSTACKNAFHNAKQPDRKKLIAVLNGLQEGIEQLRQVVKG